jgi:UDP-3-O-[3-hydroxymyristoyl] glucosamine N-acyltransferase
MFSNKVLRRMLRPSVMTNLKMIRGSVQTEKLMVDDVNLVENVEYANEISKHRPILPLYDLRPYTSDCYIAGNATLVGEVHLNPYATIWNNVVIRGEINEVIIGDYTSVGDNTVIQTVASLPTGLNSR